MSSVDARNTIFELYIGSTKYPGSYIRFDVIEQAFFTGLAHTIIVSGVRKGHVVSMVEEYRPKSPTGSIFSMAISPTIAASNTGLERYIH